MRALLDPTRELVKGSVVGLATFNEFGIPEPGEVVKTMARELRGSEPIAIVLDDTAAVWPGHVENLIVCERYVYFPSCARKFGMVTPSLLERRVDESANRGMLATAFDVLQRVHSDFFARRAAHREFTLKRSREGAALVAAPDDDDDAYVGGSAAARLRADASARRALLGSSRRESPPPYAFPVTVPELLTQEKRRVLRGTELVFSGVVPSGTDPSRHPLWRLAEAFGARCVKIPSDAATTHVVVEPANLGPGGTDKMIWATRLGKYVVTPGWVLTSAASFQRADEDAFAARR
jgi:RNA polymerase II C-terminal domain phosphatase-like 3/4